MAKLQDEATLDISDYLKKLNTIDANIAKMASHADKSFVGVSKSAQLSGVKIGAVGGIVGGLTVKFIELGHKAVAALVNVGKESVNLAADLEVTEKVFTGIFKGNKEAALAALGELRKESRALGVDLSETAAAFLPFVDNLEQVSRVGKIQAALALSQPEQGSQGARISLQNALEGDVKSLVQRFELPKTLANTLKKAMDEGGTEAFLTTFEGVLKRLGRDLDTLGGGLQQAQGQAQVTGQQIQEAFGGPVVKELTEQFNELNRVTTENFDDIELIADTFGRVLAVVVDIVGSGLTDFLANLDTEQIIEIGETFFDIARDAQTFAEVLGATDLPTDLINGVEFIADKLSEALQTAIKLAGINASQRAREEGKAKALADLGLPARSAGVPSELLLDDEQRALVEAAGEKAAQESILKTVAAIEKSTQAKQENRQATDDLAESQKKGTDAGLDEANAHLEQEAAARKLAEALEAIAGAEKEAAEKTAEATAKNQQAVEDATTDHQQKLSDISVEAERKRFDAAVDFANKRVDLARDNLDKIADIEKKNAQAVADSNLELKRDLQEIARDTTRARIDQAKDEAKKQLDIETDHLRRVQDIKQQFELDALQFEQRRDAVGFLNALRQRDQELSQATLDRERTIADTRLEGERKRQELQLQEQQQREDARIAAAQRLEDLQTDLERELEAQRTNYARAQEELTLAEQRKNEELKLWQERAIADANTAFERRLADLQLALDRELAAIKAAEEAKRAEYEATAEAAQAAATASSTPSTTGGASAGFGSNPGTIGHAFGGLVNRGQPVPVGERGPELFTPHANGRIIPNNALILPSMTPKSMVSNVNNSRQLSADISLLDPSQLSPIQRAIIKNIVLDVLNSVS